MTSVDTNTLATICLSWAVRIPAWTSATVPVRSAVIWARRQASSVCSLTKSPWDTDRRSMYCSHGKTPRSASSDELTLYWALQTSIAKDEPSRSVARKSQEIEVSSPGTEMRETKRVKRRTLGRMATSLILILNLEANHVSNVHKTNVIEYYAPFKSSINIPATIGTPGASCASRACLSRSWSRSECGNAGNVWRE